MKKEVINSLFFVIMIILVISLSTGFEIGNSSYLIQEKYVPLDNIKGWINISLDNEPANLIFEDSQENSISLIDLLRTTMNSELDYVCNPLNCESDYLASAPETEKKFNNLQNKASKIIGLKFSENIDSITSIRFNVSSNAPALCSNQLEIDLFDDNIIDFINNKSGTGACTSLRNYGCFDDAESIGEFGLGTYPKKHCQRIKLSQSPGFILGAVVNNIQGSSLKMAIYDFKDQEKASCELANAVDGENSCEVDYPITKEKDYYVCIYNQGSGNPKIKGYSSSNGCGFYHNGDNFGEEDASFLIFAQGKEFGAVDTIEILNKFPNEDLIAPKIEKYLKNKYGNLNCKTNKGCIVPLRIISGKNQNIILKDFEIKYETNLGSTTKNNFSNLTQNPATITSGFQKIFLDQGNFTLPNNYGNFTFKLSLDDEKIFSKKVFIEKLPTIQTLLPKTTASAFPTVFTVKVSQFFNISKYSWDFGNGDTQTTFTESVTYTYNSTGQYSLTIKVTDSNQKESSKTFNITVNTPEKEIETLLNKKLEDLSNIKSQIKTYDISQEDLKPILDIENSNNELKQIQKDYAIAKTEKEYNQIMTDLFKIYVPESITKTFEANSLDFFPNQNNINLNILGSISGNSLDSGKDEVEYINAIFVWNQKNLETKISFEEISFSEGGSIKPALNLFEIKINKKNDNASDAYFILKQLDDLTFKKNYSEKENSGYTYIELTEERQTIRFSTTEDIEFGDLPLFISPGIDKLNLLPCIDCGPSPVLKWKMLVLIFLFLVVIALITYVFLQQWYKYKYEKYLFKTQNYLYNLILYIEGSRKRGLKEGEIRQKLKKSGWTSEQVNYVLKKYTGKRTGMFEIPVEKALNIFKRKKQNKINQDPYQRFKHPGPGRGYR